MPPDWLRRLKSFTHDTFEGVSLILVSDYIQRWLSTTGWLYWSPCYSHTSAVNATGRRRQDAVQLHG